MKESVDQPPRLHVAVVLDPYTSTALALSEATAVAMRDNARLTLICVTPHPWPVCAPCGLVAPPSCERDQLDAAASILRSAVKDIPEGMPCTTYARCGSLVSEVAQVLDRDHPDVVFIAQRRDGRLSHYLTQRTARHLARRGAVDVAVVGSQRQTKASRLRFGDQAPHVLKVHLGHARA